MMGFKTEEVEIKYNNFKDLRKAMHASNYDKQMKVCGYTFKTLKDVCGEEYHGEYPRHLPVFPECSFLEVGSGNGCVSTVYYLTNPGSIRKLVAIDINPRAVENTKMNFEHYKIPGEVRHCDMFDGLKEGEKFDVIFWAPPFGLLPPEEPLDMLDISIGSHDYIPLERYGIILADIASCYYFTQFLFDDYKMILNKQVI